MPSINNSLPTISTLTPAMALMEFIETLMAGGISSAHELSESISTEKAATTSAASDLRKEVLAKMNPSQPIILTTFGTDSLLLEPFHGS